MNKKDFMKNIRSFANTCLPTKTRFISYRAGGTDKPVMYGHFSIDSPWFPENDPISEICELAADILNNHLDDSRSKYTSEDIIILSISKL